MLMTESRRMLETKCVGDNIEMLVSVFAVFVTNILYLIILALGTNNCHRHKVINIHLSISMKRSWEGGWYILNKFNRPLSQMTVHCYQDCRSSIFGKLKLSFRENFVLLPDQIQFLNPIMVLILIPCFNYILYPLFAKAGFQNRAISLVHFPMF